MRQVHGTWKPLLASLATPVLRTSELRHRTGGFDHDRHARSVRWADLNQQNSSETGERHDDQSHSYRLLSIGDEKLVVNDRPEDVRRAEGAGQKAGQEIGEVDDLLVDEREHKVRFLRVAAGGFLGLGETKFLRPSRCHHEGRGEGGPCGPDAGPRDPRSVLRP